MARKKKGDDTQIPDSVENILERDGGIPKSSNDKKPEEDKTPFYKVFKDSKIAVSKERGNLWKGRIDSSVRADKPFIEAGEEAIAYFRSSDEGKQAAKSRASRNLTSEKHKEEENIVFANNRTLVPIIYARNPSIEVTDNNKSVEGNEESRPRNTLFERLLNVLIMKPKSPGINLKPKARRAVLNTLLTNETYAVLGYVDKGKSSQEAVIEMQKVTDKLSKAKTKKEIEQLEGELMAIESKIDALSPEGFWLKIKPSGTVFVDPGAEPDDDDAGWVVYEDYVPTNYLNATYGEQDDKGQIVSIYEATHVLDANKSDSSFEANELQVNTFSLFNPTEKHTAYGYDNKKQFEDAKRTKVWMCWDYATRRMEMYSTKDWKFPIWVWDDPYGLEEFAPVYKLSFVDDPQARKAKSETCYYLDQQDVINEINSQERTIRTLLSEKIFYNNNALKSEDADKVFSTGVKNRYIGLDIPEGSKLRDHISTLEMPALNWAQLFSQWKQDRMRAIDRISPVSEQLRGGQFKTNTTNKAVDFVRDATSIQVEDKTDLIEDWIAKIAFGMLQIARRKMQPELVSMLLGKESGEEWRKFQDNDDPDVPTSQLFGITVAGGSTSKPNSRDKQQRATQIGQVLGQFAGTSPVALKVLLRMYSRAFDEVVVTEEDWKEIADEVTAQLQAQQAQTQSQLNQTGQPNAEGGGSPDAILAALPDGVRQIVEQVASQGVPLEQAIQETLSQLLNQQQ